MSVAKLCESIKSYADIEVLTTTANGKVELNVVPDKQELVDGVPVTYYERITKDHTHFSPALLLALHRKIKYEKNRTVNDLIIHIHSWWNLVTIFSCLVAKINNIPVALSPRGMLTNYTQNNRNSILKSAIHILLGKSLLKYVHIIASTELEKQDVLEIVKPKSISIISNLVSLPNYNPVAIKKDIDDEKFKLIFLSRIEKKKGLDILFDAIALLTINWTLDIAGTGEEVYVESLKLKAKSLNIEQKLNWIGHISNENKFELMKNYDLFVLSSHNENFANVVIECLSVGTPVFLSDKVGLSNYVLNNELGFVSSLQPKEIAFKLTEAFENKEKREHIRTSAPAVIEKDFNETTLTKNYINQYEKILNSK